MGTLLSTKRRIIYDLVSGHQGPKISGFLPNPQVVYQFQPTNFKCNLSQGTGPVYYNFRWANKPEWLWESFLTITQNQPESPVVTISICTNCPGLPPQWWSPQIECTAWNYDQNTSTYKRDTKSFYITLSSNNGCPWLFVTESDTISKIDNNLLNKSKFPGYFGQDITDSYVLTKTPGIIDSTIVLTIGETTTDTSFINSIKLYAVDHPLGTKICLTEDGQIAMFDSASVLSVNAAFLNGIEITEDIQFHLPPRGPVYSDTLDHINASFDNYNIINPGIIADLKFNPNQTSYQKNWDGLININLGNENFTSDFSRREYKSITAIPVTNSGGEEFSINHIEIDWYKGNDVRYIALASLSYSGFAVSELPFLSAFNSSGIDEINKVISIDNLYSMIDFSNSLKLEFKALSSQPYNQIRDYIIEVNGRIGAYLDPIQKFKSKRLKTVKQKNNTVAFINKLNQNYPNPFNPLTKISYSVAKQGLVKIKIYDILGREIKSLVNEIKGPGNYLIEFNGSNLASGVYFYRFEINGFVEVKKMVLIK